MIEGVQPAKISNRKGPEQSIPETQCMCHHLVHIFKTGIALIHNVKRLSQKGKLKPVCKKALGIFSDEDRFLPKIYGDIIHCLRCFLAGLRAKGHFHQRDDMRGIKPMHATEVFRVLIGFGQLCDGEG